jgi:outer membrane immunogenic protein
MHQKLMGTVAAVAIATALSGPVVAADLRMPVKAQPVAAPAVYAPTWTGFYIGGHIGTGWSRHEAQTTAPEEGLDVGARLHGLALGLHSGYNWQFNQWVVGYESDATVTPWEQTLTAESGVSLRRRTDWLASLRGRLGLTFDRALIYATGGVAFAQAHAVRLTGSVSGSVDFNSTGYVLGGGIEWKYTPNLSLRLEGLYYGFNETKGGGPTESGFALTEKLKDFTVVRVGASWYFGQGNLWPFGIGKGKGPVVASY